MTDGKALLFYISKMQKPWFLKNIPTLPTEYAANRKAWTMGKLFRKWLLNFDRRMELSNSQVLLIVDNRSAPKVGVEPKATRLVFVPANMTAAL